MRQPRVRCTATTITVILDHLPRTPVLPPTAHRQIGHWHHNVAWRTTLSATLKPIAGPSSAGQIMADNSPSIQSIESAARHSMKATTARPRLNQTSCDRRQRHVISQLLYLYASNGAERRPFFCTFHAAGRHSLWPSLLHCNMAMRGKDFMASNLAPSRLIRYAGAILLYYRCVHARPNIRNIAIIAHVDHGKPLWLTSSCANRRLPRPRALADGRWTQ